jgi:hypothetical protein
MSWLDLFTSLSPNNPLIRTLPLIWLFFWGLLESKKDFKTKSFYCGTLKKLSDKNNVVRAECEVRNRNINERTPDTCPIFKNLMTTNFTKTCPKSLIEEKRDYFLVQYKKYVCTISTGTIF